MHFLCALDLYQYIKQPSPYYILYRESSFYTEGHLQDGTPNERLLAHYILARTYVAMDDVPQAIETVYTCLFIVCLFFVY